MAQLDGEPVLCCGYEAQASVPGQQWCKWGHTALHPQQEQLTDPYVQPAGWNTGHMSAQRTKLFRTSYKITYINIQVLFQLLSLYSVGWSCNICQPSIDDRLSLWNSEELTTNGLLCAKQTWIPFVRIYGWIRFNLNWNELQAEGK